MVISDPKNFVAVFLGNFEGKNYELLGKGGGAIRKISLQILAPPEKKRNIIFRNEGGGVRGRLEFFRKFIRFGGPRRPLGKLCPKLMIFLFKGGSLIM